jgi:hypothetical protein
LRNLRRVASRIAAIPDEIGRELQEQRSEYLAWVIADQEAAQYETESREAADEELAIAQSETPVLVIGSLVLYGLSLLETALADAAADAAARRGIAIPRQVRGGKIAGWLDFLRANCGVDPDWPPAYLEELEHWRRLRNAYAHELRVDGGEEADRPSPREWSLEGFIAFLVRGLDALDEAMADVS